MDRTFAIYQDTESGRLRLGEWRYRGKGSSVRTLSEAYYKLHPNAREGGRLYIAQRFRTLGGWRDGEILPMEEPAQAIADPIGEVLLDALEELLGAWRCRRDLRGMNDTEPEIIEERVAWDRGKMLKALDDWLADRLARAEGIRDEADWYGELERGYARDRI